MVGYSYKNNLFLPHHLDSRNTSEREVAREIVPNYLKTCSWYVKFKFDMKCRFIMTKIKAKIDTKAEFSWVSNFHPRNQA